MVFTNNKHLIVAIIVAPVLAVLSYLFVDALVKEQPQPAVEGENYPLTAQSNCRYTSGRCDLENADFRVSLAVTDKDKQPVLVLTANYDLDNALIGFSDTDEQTSVQPSQMQASSKDKKSWSIELPAATDINTQLMLVMFANGSRYYADSTMEFRDYQTTFYKTFKND